MANMVGDLKKSFGTGGRTAFLPGSFESGLLVHNPHNKSCCRLRNVGKNSAWEVIETRQQ